ncbi:hypothetical protein ACLOJK_037530, partial [Asimina triloba]
MDRLTKDARATSQDLGRPKVEDNPWLLQQAVCLKSLLPQVTYPGQPPKFGVPVMRDSISPYGAYEQYPIFPRTQHIQSDVNASSPVGI